MSCSADECGVEQSYPVWIVADIDVAEFEKNLSTVNPSTVWDLEIQSTGATDAYCRIPADLE